MMGMYKFVITVWIYILTCLSTVYGLTCTCDNIEEGQELECQCDTVNAIQWFKGNTELTVCDGATCFPNSITGHTFSHTGSNYKITISTFSFTNCKGYTAKDLTTQETGSFPYCPVLTMTKPTIGGQINILENTPEVFICKMTSGSPAGTVKWYVDTGTSDVEITTNISSSSAQSPADNQEEYITTSTLTLFPPRSYSGYRIYCNATNKPEQTPLISQRKPQLNILYPPSMLNFYYGTLTGQLIAGKTIDVISGETFSIGCKSMDGEPEPTIKWNGQISNEPILTVQQIQESQTGKTCTATNQMLASGTSQQGRISDIISFNILVPPTMSKCEFYNNKTNSVLTNVNTLMILEGESFTLTCSAAGKPSPNPLWSGPTSSLASWSLPENDVTRQEKGVYTFSATSMMKPSFQPSKTVTANETITIEILYPPGVHQMADISRDKGLTLTVDCPYTEGFPTETSTQWKRDIDSKTWNNKRLTIPSITKSDAGIYTCVATNIMQPSGDTQSYTGKDEKHFVLTVLYEPDEPTDFRHVENQATQSTIQLEWTPGFNGGPPQTFYIKYKQSSSHTWSYVDVSDNGEQIMRYRLTGLMSNTTYQLIIYSANIKGNSSESNTLTAKTKVDKYSENTKSLNPAPVVAGVVSGVIICAAFAVVTIFLVRRYRARKGTSNSSAETARRNQHETNKPADHVSYYNVGRGVHMSGQSNPAYNNEGSARDYEALNSQNRDVMTYSTLQPVSSNPKNDETSDESKPYENLKLSVI